MRRLTHEQFIERLSISNPDITAIGKYVNMHTKIECVCPVGHHWFPIAQDVIRGEGCSKCGLISRVSKRTKTHEQFVEEVRNLHPNITVVGEYVNSNTKIEFMCSKGHVWKTAPYNILDGCSCPVCKGEKISAQKTKSHKQFVDELLQVNPNIAVLGEYKGTFTKIKTGGGDLCRSQNA